MTRRYPRPERALAALLVAALAAAAVASAGALASCSQRLGWGVVLWTSPDGPLPAGTVAPVLIRSNIQKVFVVGVPGSSRKVELPFWQVELFSSKGKASAEAARFAPYARLYLTAARDGLPLREKPANQAKRVFRLREGQAVKVLDKVKGEPVTTGGEVLPGDWYEVLADDGTRGFVYSYAMRAYDETKEGRPAAAAAPKAASPKVDLVFSRQWRPEYFQEMVDDQRVDLDFFSQRFGLFADAIHRQVRIELPAASRVFNYESISEEGEAFVFEGTRLRVRLEGDHRLVASWTDRPDKPEAPAAAGAPPAPVSVPASLYGSEGRAAFVVLLSDPRAAIRDEELRRQRLLESFLDKFGSEWGPRAEGPGPGKLTIARSRRVTWTDRGGLVPGFLPEGATETGEAAFRLFLAPEAAADWDGAFSIRFDPRPSESGGPVERTGWVDFLYRITPEGLSIARAASGFVGLAVAAPDQGFDPVTFRSLSRTR